TGSHLHKINLNVVSHYLLHTYVGAKPLDLVLKPSFPLEISCTISGYSNPYVYWYKWSKADGIKLKFTSLAKDLMDPSEDDGFSASRPEDLQSVLKSTRAPQSDPAVWYCAASAHSVREKVTCCTKT
uniref:Ig-like domain-containing protein n=1 Tax=Denticeps clupeoides TaxID=299321 RepID=A0AAY4ADS8_9TELE